MNKFLKAIDGNKTYISALALIGCSVARYFGVLIPDEVVYLLGGTTAISLRHGLSKNVKLGDEIGQELGKQIVRRRKKLAILAPLFIAFTTISCAQKVDGQCAIECTSACAARCTNECSKAMAENEVN